MSLSGLPIFISQKLSPFSCCQKTINTEKQLKLYQTQILQPKNQSIQKIARINNFYQPNHENNYKVVGQSNYQKQLNKCKIKHQMFYDNQFPPNKLSLGQNKSDKKIVWRRLSEIYDAKKYPVFDINQEIDSQELQICNMKNNSYMPILDLLIKRSEIIKQIFRNSHQELNNFGIYKLILNQRGYPREIVIDDFIPVYQNSDMHPYSRPLNNQLWPLIIQKALAKVIGCYQEINSIKIHQILRILVMGPTVKCQLEENLGSTKYLQNWNHLKQAINENLPIFCTSKLEVKSNKIIPNFSYMISSIQMNKNQESDSLIIMTNPQYLFEQVSENSSQQQPMSIPSTSIKYSQVKRVLKLKYSTFLKNFSSFCVCNFRQNYNFDFQAGEMINRNAQFFKLKIGQPSHLILSYTRVKRDFYRNGYVHFSSLQNTFRNFVNIKGGWLKILVAKRKLQNNQFQLHYMDAMTQTQDNTLSLNFRHLTSGEYIIFVEGYSQQNEKQFYVFSAFSQKVFSLEREIPMQVNKQYFLQEVMLNHCIKFQQKNKTLKNYFIEDDQQSWYVSNLMYKNGSFGYVVVYLSKESPHNIRISFSKEKLKQQGYKLQCKRIKNYYQKLLKAGEADVLVFSLDYKTKSQIDIIQFPPKCIKIKLETGQKHESNKNFRHSDEEIKIYDSKFNENTKMNDSKFKKKEINYNSQKELIRPRNQFNRSGISDQHGYSQNQEGIFKQKNR